MPSRKSDSSRKGDVSVARFVLAEDGTPPSPEGSSHPAQQAAASSSPPTGSSKPANTPAAGERPTSADASTAGTSQHATGDKKDKEKDGTEALSIEDLNLPRSIITRLAKGVLPPNTQIQANAILALTKSATVFINHLASAANEHTLSANKKTIMPNDVLQALDEVDYGFMKARVEAEFATFNDIQTFKRSTYRKRVAAAKKAAAGDAGGGGEGPDAGADMDASMLSSVPGDDTSLVGATSAADASALEGSGRAAKKLKTSGVGDDGSRMDVDEDGQEPSDAETVPEEEGQDDEDDDDVEVEEEQDEEEEEEEGEGTPRDDEGRDGLEVSRAPREIEDEALDSEDDDRD